MIVLSFDQLIEELCRVESTDPGKRIYHMDGQLNHARQGIGSQEHFPQASCAAFAEAAL
jgi:hypothetical protein